LQFRSERPNPEFTYPGADRHEQTQTFVKRFQERKPMRRIASVFLFAAVSSVLSLIALPAYSQPPASDTPRNRVQPDRNSRDVRPPPPPLLSAIDSNDDGEISAEELKQASAALKKLDANKDGQIADRELMLDRASMPMGFRRGGRGGPRGGFDSFGGSPPGDAPSPHEIEFQNGTAAIADHATYHRLSYRGEQVMIDTFLIDLEFVKFTLNKASTDERQLISSIPKPTALT